MGPATLTKFLDKIETPSKVVSRDIETHFHNGTGCAIANVDCESGATHIDATVLGIGERNGIMPLGGFTGCLIAADREYIMSKYKIDKLGYIENLVAQVVGVENPSSNCDASLLTKARSRQPEYA